MADLVEAVRPCKPRPRAFRSIHWFTAEFSLGSRRSRRLPPGGWFCPPILSNGRQGDGHPPPLARAFRHLTLPPDPLRSTMQAQQDRLSPELSWNTKKVVTESPVLVSSHGERASESDCTGGWTRTPSFYPPAHSSVRTRQGEQSASIPTGDRAAEPSAMVVRFVLRAV
jgi:hypothetical protein